MGCCIFYCPFNFPAILPLPSAVVSKRKIFTRPASRKTIPQIIGNRKRSSLPKSAPDGRVVGKGEFAKSIYTNREKVADRSEGKCAVMESKYRPVYQISLFAHLPPGQILVGVATPNPPFAACAAEKSPQIFFRIFQKQFRFTPCFSPISERTNRSKRKELSHHATQDLQHPQAEMCCQDPSDRGRAQSL